MRYLNLFLVFILFSGSVFALSCKQSEIVALSEAHQQTALLSDQFKKIDHIEILPQKITSEDKGFRIETIQVLMCGELLPQPRKATGSATSNPTKGSTTITGQCQFDSDCSRPKRCLNNQCLMPNGP